ncbi:MAG: 50S ribosomal protein L9 [Metamycoplasmataceae bacterium]
MKVIIIKNCKDGKINDIIEVSSGYGTNFLIKNGFAEPINKSSNLQLQKRLENSKKLHEERVKEAMELKNKLEKITLEFSLKVTNLIVHGSITTKQVNIKLKEWGFHLEKHSVPHLHITSLGITMVPIKLFEKIEATLKILVSKSE